MTGATHVAALMVIGCIGTFAGVAIAADVAAELQTCRSQAGDAPRLKCYDDVAKRAAPPRFAGRHHAQTDVFTIDKPHTLRYRSDGPIFVLYLKKPDGAVVQNLHVGGVGEGSHLIEKAGDYFLQVDGAESWAIWLDPVEE